MNGRNRTALVIATRLPFPVDDGWKARTFQVTRAAGMTMRTTLLVFGSDNEASGDAAAALGPNVSIRMVTRPRAYTPEKLALGLATRLPLQMWNQRSATMRRVLRRVVAEESPHTCIFATSCVYPLAAELPRSTVKIIDTHNIDSLTYARYAIGLANPLHRWYMGITAKKYAAYERHAFVDADQVWTCSEPDRVAALDLAPTAHVRVVANGVDTDAFRSLGPVSRERGRLLFFGRLDYLPNVDAIRYFLTDIFPLVRDRIPGCTIDIVGAGSTEAVARLVDGVKGARLIGRVDDIKPELMRSAATVVPLRIGGGTRLKILEALAMECPIVTTTLGAEGLDVVHGRDVLMADTAADFATEVVRVLGDNYLAVSLSSEGRRTVERLYDWGHILNSAYATISSIDAAGPG